MGNKAYLDIPIVALFFHEELLASWGICSELPVTGLLLLPSWEYWKCFPKRLHYLSTQSWCCGLFKNLGHVCRITTDERMHVSILALYRFVLHVEVRLQPVKLSLMLGLELPYRSRLPSHIFLAEVRLCSGGFKDACSRSRRKYTHHPERSFARRDIGCSDGAKRLLTLATRTRSASQ
ncbi:hypothetical protein B0H34DRAFT_196892 [Crassisporium funariophilum]|nr:hypothetical protein B0H34DRAFT_196892 [Crassisporium funariophilum]